MGSHVRYTREEDELLLHYYWDKDARKRLSEYFKGRHSHYSMHCRYYKLLSDSKTDPAEHARRMQQKIVAGEIPPLEDVLSGRIDHTSGRPAVVATFQGDSGNRPLDEFRMYEIAGHVVSSFEDELNKRLDSRLDSLQRFVEERIRHLEQRLEEGRLAHSDALSLFSIIYERAKQGDPDKLREMGEQLAAAKAALDERAREIQALRDEAQRLRDEVQRIRDEKSELVQRHARIHQELDFWLGRFLGLSSVEKVASLRDFIPRLKVVVDRFGTVLSATAEGGFFDDKSEAESRGEENREYHLESGLQVRTS